MVGTVSKPSSFAASNRPCPAMTQSSPSISNGVTKRYFLTLLLSARICRLACFRGLRGLGFSRSTGWYSIRR